jgi:hypothetical protein
MTRRTSPPADLGRRNSIAGDAGRAAAYDPVWRESVGGDEGHCTNVVRLLANAPKDRSPILDRHRAQPPDFPRRSGTGRGDVARRWRSPAGSTIEKALKQAYELGRTEVLTEQARLTARSCPTSRNERLPNRPATQHGAVDKVRKYNPLQSWVFDIRRPARPAPWARYTAAHARGLSVSKVAEIAKRDDDSLAMPCGGPVSSRRPAASCSQLQVTAKSFIARQCSRVG